MSCSVALPDALMRPGDALQLDAVITATTPTTAASLRQTVAHSRLHLFPPSSNHFILISPADYFDFQ